MATILTWAMVLAVGYGIWLAVRPRSLFVIRIRGGRPRVASGTVTRSFLREVEEVCARTGQTRGTVRGAVRGERVVLGFSREIPDRVRQNLRNLWNVSGWSTRPRTG